MGRKDWKLGREGNRETREAEGSVRWWDTGDRMGRKVSKTPTENPIEFLVHSLSFQGIGSGYHK